MPKECSHDSHSKFERLIGPLRVKARQLGYAIGVHGTLKRDIDLIAVPWTGEAVSPKMLADALQVVARGIVGYAEPSYLETSEYFQAGSPGLKPHGRLTWSFHLGGGPYIDLSVMPRVAPTDRHPYACPNGCQGYMTSDTTDGGLICKTCGLNP